MLTQERHQKERKQKYFEILIINTNKKGLKFLQAYII